MPEQTEHKRRVRYKGTHPRTFEEKYKEHDPERYADTVAKVISKGSTPAGMHISIMVKEILDFLQIQILLSDISDTHLPVRPHHKQIQTHRRPHFDLFAVRHSG